MTLQPVSTDTLAFVLPDTPGGVYALTSNVLASRTRDDARYRCIVVRTHARHSNAARAVGSLHADAEVFVEHDLPFENLFSVMRRLRSAVAGGPGVIIANDWLELATSATYDTGKAVVSITHGDSAYYYGLATTFEKTIDAFIAVSEYSHAQLCSMLPHRVADIHHVRTGVEIPAVARAPHQGPIRVIYVGRFDAAKNVMDLPRIAALLAERGIATTWTLFGDGPEHAAVESAWPTGVPVKFCGQAERATVLAAYAQHDVFILASSVEGLPVTLLEAGAAGVVPIVSDLPSGIPEVVDESTGILCRVGEPSKFADAVAILAHDREALERLSTAVRARIATRFDITHAVPQYMRVADHAAARRRAHGWQATGPFTGSRLDRRWIPNAIVRALRKAAVRKPRMRMSQIRESKGAR